jgi:ferredoxin|tara:strand:- start:9 stop:290 length:282 start_codon:yes stop_codon:yes gene_type:complete
VEQNNTTKVAVLKINMFKWFKKSKPITLGRWAIQQQHITRKIDLANCDSCGVCPTIKPSLKLKYKYMIVDDDIVLEGTYNITDKGTSYIKETI